MDNRDYKKGFLRCVQKRETAKCKNVLVVFWVLSTIFGNIITIQYIITLFIIILLLLRCCFYRKRIVARHLADRVVNVARRARYLSRDFRSRFQSNRTMITLVGKTMLLL